MNREQLAHVLRAASRIAGEPDVVVIGSQAILGSYDEAQLPDEAIASIEVDVTFFEDEDDAKSDKVDAAIGELSSFHENEPVLRTRREHHDGALPEGWRERLVLFESPSSQPGRVRCLDPHHLVASKLVANREKDREFAAALLRERLLTPDKLIERIRSLPIEPQRLESMASWVEARR